MLSQLLDVIFVIIFSLIAIGWALMLKCFVSLLYNGRKFRRYIHNRKRGRRYDA